MSAKSAFLSEKASDAEEKNMQLGFGDDDYVRYLDAIPASKTHAGYFSIDKKGHITNSKSEMMMSSKNEM